MRWTKRLKWIRASKIIIPIALAISLIFAGFSVYAKEAEYFVLRINNGDGVSLALTMNRDLSDQTPRLRVPVSAGYEDATWTPDSSLKYNPNGFGRNLPNDIAKYDGEHSVYETRGRYSFYSFSFWLVNNSSRAVDVDMRFNIDSMAIGPYNTTNKHIDEAVRVMVIEGEPLLSDPNSYIIYKKAEKPEVKEYEENGQKFMLTNEQWLTRKLIEQDGYDNTKTVSFESDICVFDNSGELGILNLGEGETKRFTIVIWLEGWDPECEDPIKGDTLKMSIDFTGH